MNRDPAYELRKCGPVRVAVADDQALLRHSLAMIINGAADLQIVAEADSGHEMVEVLRDVPVDVVVMDIRMPGIDGIEATRQITANPAHNQVKILVLSMFELDEYVYGALRAGASGFLLKDAHPEHLIDAIRRTDRGESLFAPSILTTLVSHYLHQPPHKPTPAVDMLTARETEVLRLVARGQSNAEISQTLCISVKTVKTYIGNLLAKLDARDRAQLVIAAYESRVVSSGTM